MPRTAPDIVLSLPAPSKTTPIRVWLYDSIRGAILSGKLQPQSRLPATRDLARQYGISRGSVIAAFEQLTAEGYIESRTGSGTHVSRSAPDDFFRTAHSRSPEEPRIHSGLLARVTSTAPPPPPLPPKRISAPFRANQPSIDLFPWDVWTRASGRTARTFPARLLANQNPAGFLPLRKAVAAHVAISRGIHASEEQILIFSGVQSALSTAARVLLDHGAPACVEDPGYPAARRLLQLSGARVISVPVDGAGLDLAAGRARIKSPRLIYVTPAHQAPLGVAMTLERRLELLAWAESAQGWIFEDDYDGEFRFSGRPAPALKAIDRAGCVLYAGSFSKMLFPSLRIGFLIVPASLVEPFERVRWLMDRFNPTFEQAVLFRFIDEGHLGRHLRRMRQAYAERYEVLRQCCDKELGGRLRIEPANTGLQTVAWCEQNLNDLDLAAKAQDAGIETLPVSASFFEVPKRSGLILGFSTASPRSMRAAAGRLAGLLPRRP